MKRHILYIMLCFVVGMFSHGKAFAGTNKLELQNITLDAGTTEATLPIILTNEDKISGFQCDLYLPEGVEAGVDEYGDYLMEMSRTTAKRHSVSSREMSDGAIRLVYSSMTNATFSGNSGIVLTLTLKVKGDIAIGEYSISLKNIVLTDPSAARYTSDDVTAVLTVQEVKPVTVTVKSYSREYGEANPAFEYTVEGAELDGMLEITCEATPESPVGEYPIVIKKGSVTNSKDTYVNGTLTVTKAPLTITAKSYSIKQGEALPTFEAEFSGFKNSETGSVLSKQPSITCSATSASEPGTYDIAVSDAEAGNYEISYVKGTLTITAADPVTVTAKSYTRKYGEANPAFEYTVEGAALDGTPEIICEATATSPVGEYPIVIRKGSVKNYNDTYVNGTLTITKAPLTIAAGTYTKKQGDPLPEFTLTFDGFRNNETKDVLTKQPVVACEADEASAPGEYAVKVSGAEASNYTISYTDGKLIVTEADAIVVTAKSYTRKYGDENPTFEYEVSGGTLTGKPEISCEATAASPVGTYDIVVKQGTVENFNVSFVAGKLTVEKAPLTIAAGTYTKKQGDPLPEFTLTFDGFRNNETKDVLTKQPVVACEADEATAPGEYAVKVSGAEAANYAITYTDGKLIVTEADAIVVTAKSYTRKYGDENPTFEYEVSGGTLTGKPEISCEATAASPVGTYDIVISKGTVENFNVSFVAGKLTVEKAPLTIAAGTYTKKQGDPLPEFTLTFDGFRNNETKDVLTKQPVVACEADEASAPGEYAVKVSGAEASNYTISYTDGKLIVTEADAIVVTAKSYTRKYGDENPTFEYEVSGGALTGKPEISCSATPASPVGTYGIVISKGSVENFNVSFVAGKLTVEKAPLTIAAGTYTKKQGDPLPEFTLTFDGFRNNETKDVLTKQPVVACEADEATAPGEYAVKVSGAEAVNYDISYTDGKLIITEADAIVVTAKSYTRKYGDENPTFEYEVSGGTLTGKPEISCEATAASPVGTYDIVISKGTVENFNVSFVAGKLTVEKAPLTIAAGTYTKKQGDPLPEFTLSYSGFRNNETKDVLTKQPIVACEADETSAPGEYAVKVSGAEAANYDITYTDGKLIVTEADAIVVTAKSYTRKYGDENPTFEYEVTGGTLTGKPEISCEATPASPVGTYDIVISKGTVENYNVIFVSGTLVVEKAPLTITVSDAKRIYGEENPVFMLSYEGFVNDEDETVLDTMPTIQTAAEITSDVGQYDLIVNGADAKNYIITYINGTLTIEKAPQEIVWEQELLEAMTGDTIALTAYSTSGLPVEYELDNNDVVILFEEEGLWYLSCTGEGTVQIRAKQEGDKNHLSAEEVVRSVNVLLNGLNNVSTDNHVELSYDINGIETKMHENGIQIVVKKGENGKRIVYKQFIR